MTGSPGSGPGVGSGSGSAAGARPLLMLDVDGVLLVWRGGAWDPDGARDEDVRDGGADDEVGFHPDAAGWLAELARAFELCWATTWEDQANRDIGPALGLGRLPFVEFEMDYRARTPKLRSLAAWVGDRPCAWIDDDLHADAESWAAGRSAPTLLVHVDAEEGMARRHVDELLDWAVSQAAGGGR
jgi:hypothetical protein